MATTAALPRESPEREPDLLRITTAGSVDDGKSTLIGRLLHDAGAIYEDQLDALRAKAAAGAGAIDLSLITDGLRAEREQGITIDVAYRYFSTPRRPIWTFCQSCFFRLLPVIVNHQS